MKHLFLITESTAETYLAVSRRRVASSVRRKHCKLHNNTKHTALQYTRRDLRTVRIHREVAQTRDSESSPIS